jgi:hypothetical protein
MYRHEIAGRSTAAVYELQQCVPLNNIIIINGDETKLSIIQRVAVTVAQGTHCRHHRG